MDVLLNLVSPVGLIPLFILAGGIFIYVIVALGGWGERTITPDSKVFLGILGTVLSLIGLIGIILVVYPVVRPNVIQIQQDLNLPNPLSTPIPKPAPTPLSPRDQAIKDAAEIGLSIFVALFGLVAIITITIMMLGMARMMWTMSDSSATFLPRPPRFISFLRTKSTNTPKQSRSVTYRPDDDEKE
jgi:hypothetical protein